MVAELISVGTEILLGDIVNTNAAYLSEKCAFLGIGCYMQTTVGDNAKRLADTVRAALERADLLIFSGGLGPTQDDLTKETVAFVLSKEMVMDEPSRKNIEDFFAARGLEPTENNWKQAMIPAGSKAVQNENGTAPGIIIEEQGKILILLPGPPGELIPMFEQDILPYLKAKEPGVILSRTVKLCGIGESQAETVIRDLMDEGQNPTVAPYAKVGEVHLRVTARAEDEKTAKRMIGPVIQELKNRLAEYIYTTKNKTSLEAAVLRLLEKNGFSLSVAESCTGGLLAARLINVPGASRVFQEGFITYSNKAKRRSLGVRRSTLKTYGAVSKETAAEMAVGGAELTDSEVFVGITGIAGPDGGTKEKPVGLVYIGCFIDGEISVREYRFSGGRAKIRESAAVAALVQLWQELKNLKD